MSYEKNTWAKGDTITAEKLNNMEAGIEAAVAGAGDTRAKALVDRTITEYADDSATAIAPYVFYGCEKLKSCVMPKSTTVGKSAFYGCKELLYVDTAVAEITDEDFSGDGVFPLFNLCYSLRAIVLRHPGVVSLSYQWTNELMPPIAGLKQACHHFNATTDPTYNPNGNYDGYLYVPRDYINDYSSSPNYAVDGACYVQIRAIEDYTIDGTLEGEMDWEKVLS